MPATEQPEKPFQPGFGSGAFGRLLLSVLLVWQSGCVSPSPEVPSREVRDRLGVIAIVPARYVPASNFQVFAKSALSGAAKGAAILGGTSAATIAATAGATGPYAPVYVLVGLLTTLTVTTIGAVEGSRVAVPPDVARRVESTIYNAVARLDAQNRLTRQLSLAMQAESGVRPGVEPGLGPTRPEAEPDYSPLKARGVETVLEVAISNIGFESCGPGFIRRISGACPSQMRKKVINLFLEAEARLVRVSDGKELYRRKFRYKSAFREISRWVADNGRMLTSEFDHAYRELAGRIRDEILLVTPLPLIARTGHGLLPDAENPRYGICWLKPESPKTAPMLLSELWRGAFPATLPSDVCPASGLHTPAVDSVRPTLRWETFPRELDRHQLDSVLIQRIGHVTYEVRIWREENCERGRLVYERTGLRKPEHVVQESLSPATRYFWSIRARFDLDGRPSVTRWSHFSAQSCRQDDILDWQYHRFATQPRQ